MKRNNISFFKFYNKLLPDNIEEYLYININLDILHLFYLYYPYTYVGIEDYYYLFDEFKCIHKDSLSEYSSIITKEDYDLFMFIANLYYKYKEDTSKMILSERKDNIYFNLNNLVNTEYYKEYIKEVDFPNYILGLIAIKEYTSDD